VTVDLYVGEVMHRRSRPKAYEFVYRVFNIVVDIDRLRDDAVGRRLFSYNRFNLFSFYDRDHGARDGSTLRPWVEKHLAAAGLSHAAAHIRLLCMPRVLGYVFDPISIYYCSDLEGNLAAVLYEVKNTFGDQHGYLFPVERGQTAPQDHVADKIFHVSPLIAMNARYRIRTASPDDRLAVLIRESDEEGEFLVATLTGERRDMTDAALLSRFFRIPFLTLKIMIAIHFEAIRLMLRGVKYTTRPEPPAKEVSLPPPRRDAA
jgi:DUF1365 family protein